MKVNLPAVEGITAKNFVSPEKIFWKRGQKEEKMSHRCDTATAAVGNKWPQQEPEMDLQ